MADSYGFEIISDHGMVIASQDYEHLNFLGRYFAYAVAGPYNQYINNYWPTSNSRLTGYILVWFYVGYPNGGNQNIIPTIFVRPDYREYSRKYFIHQITENINGWTIGIAMESTPGSDATYWPSIYVFVNSDAVESRDNYGIQLFNRFGRKTFDTSFRPLNVIDTISMKPPEYAGASFPNTSYRSLRTYWKNYTLYYSFHTDGTTSTNAHAIRPNIDNSNIMFTCQSRALCVSAARNQGYKKSCGFLGCCCQEHWSQANWSVQYREAFMVNNNTLYSGWLAYDSGYSSWAMWEDGGWFGGDGGSVSSGTVPYLGTINRTINPILIADASRYD